MLGDDLEQRLARFRRLPRLVRVVYARPRTFIGLVVGIAVFLLAPSSLRVVTRFLIGWDAFAAIYIALVYVMMLGSEQRYVRFRAVQQDDGRFLILLVTARKRTYRCSLPSIMT